MEGTTQGGEIVQVEGGHILRSTCRKDRHSKVYTSKGLRDRRVRLSAHTAIQFYDVQDRLGYDRPSKAVDWLIKKAKTAIDKLNELAPATDSPLDQKSEIHYNPSGCSNSLFMAAPGDQPDADIVNTMKPFFASTDFSGFSGDYSASRAAFHAGDRLGLTLRSLHADNQGISDNFHGSFQRINYGWNTNSGNMENGVGFLMNSLENSQDETAVFAHREFPESNVAMNPWDQRPLASADEHNSQPYSTKTPDYFELGFHVPARIYGDEEADNHQ